MMSSAHTQFQLAINRGRPSSKGAPKPKPKRPIPRLTGLLALALKFEGLLETGIIRDYADLARLGCVTRARMTQIMQLLDLAPDIQEEILFDQPAVTERDVRPVTRSVDWTAQRSAWRQLVAPGDLS